MATVVEMSIPALIQPEHHIQRRRPSFVEVIDVDLLDEPEPRPIPRTLAQQPPVERTIISLLDSDDDEADIAPVASGSARQGS